MRRLRRAFGHVPKSVMINLVRAAKVRKEFVDAVKLQRCETCEKTSPKKPAHKVTLPSDYTFNRTLGIDLLELTDVTGQKYQVLNMVCVGACLQQAETVKVGAGQASSRSCLSPFSVTEDYTTEVSCNNTWMSATFRCTTCHLRVQNRWEGRNATAVC